MKLWTRLPLDDIRAIAREAGVDIDHGNSTLDCHKLRDGRNRFTGLSIRPDRSTVRYSTGPRGGQHFEGYKWSKRSASPFGSDRRVFAVCWHGHFVFLSKIMRADPAARLQTMFYDACGIADWYDKATASAYRNVGAPIYPMQANEVCDCYENGDWANYEIADSNINRMVSDAA